jgi:dTMP kinase
LHRGLFITLEGIDGSGKTTQLVRLAEYLRQRGHTVRVTREPGGSFLGEEIRRILLRSGESAAKGGERERHPAIAPMAELALVYAARAQHLADVLRPSLARGDIVISDRYNDASLAYQGYARKLGFQIVRAFDSVVCGPTQPHLTIVLDLPPQVGLSRAMLRERKGNSKRTRFELEGVAFQRRVRAGYLEIARHNPERVKVVRANRPADQVAADIRGLVDDLVQRWPRTKRKSSKPERKRGA